MPEVKDTVVRLFVLLRDMEIPTVLALYLADNHQVSDSASR